MRDYELIDTRFAIWKNGTKFQWIVRIARHFTIVWNM